jgi:hypothetical protein
MRSDDLVPVLGNKNSNSGLGFRQGVLLSWDSVTAANTVSVGGTVMTNLNILNPSEAQFLAPGDVVTILTGGISWGILGRLVIPGTPEAAAALAAFKTQSNTVSSPQSTTSSSFVDLGTVGPSVTATIGPSGKAVLWMSAEVTCAAPTGGGITSAQAQMAFVGSGANTIGTGANRAVNGQILYNSSQSGGFDTAIQFTASMSSTYLLEGLTPGATTFTAKYRRASGTGTVTFDNRNITVIVI